MKPKTLLIKERAENSTALKIRTPIPPKLPRSEKQTNSSNKKQQNWQRENAFVVHTYNKKLIPNTTVKDSKKSIRKTQSKSLNTCGTWPEPFQKMEHRD